MHQLYAISNQPEGFKVMDHGGNLFQFFFDNETDLIRIEKSTLVIEKLYFESKTVESLRKKVGGAIGEVLESEIFSLRGKEEHFLKVKVKLNVTQPLKRSIKISGSNHKVLEVNLKYEHIGNFCHHCGFVGYEIRSCHQHLEDTANRQVKEEQWGSWLQYENPGRKIEAQKDNSNPNHSNKKDEHQQTSRKPTPVNLICAFASLSVDASNL
ncbi:hypothetical protein PIB30_034272 [Stylosanthes scabra]|uniref:Zinc knuckle CX2CX4HX4C domain-containing protein n=1 Tax=Stylosanthes scabra TaxID=79078 RepID=A0ABU6XB67_9FABA|nr:hypothetical protein [Stylosanthes scabra]